MFLHLLVVLHVSAAPIVPTAGVEWTPFSRADLVWVDEGRTSQTGVGEFDGFTRPSLMAFGGLWWRDRWGVTAGIGLARLQSTNWTDEVFVQRHWGVVRPSVDLRASILKRDKKLPIPWIIVGGHADIPSAREVSNGFTEEETEVADVNATIERARLGGWGFRGGAGIDYGINPYVRIGAQWTVEWHRSTFKSSELTAVSSWVGSQGALLLSFEWPETKEER